MIKLALCKNANISQKEFAKNLQTAYLYFREYFGTKFSSQISTNLSKSLYFVTDMLEADKDLARSIKDFLFDYSYGDSIKEKVICEVVDKYIAGENEFVTTAQLAQSYYTHKLKKTYPNVETLEPDDFMALANISNTTDYNGIIPILQKLTGQNLNVEQFKNLLSSLILARKEFENVKNTFGIVANFAYDFRFQQDNPDAIKILKDTFSDDYCYHNALHIVRRYYLGNDKFYEKPNLEAEACYFPNNSLFKENYFTKPAVLLKKDYPNFVIIHELTHIVSTTNLKDYNNIKAGVCGGELGKVAALNEVLTDYFSQDIVSLMEKDGNLIGNAERFPSLYEQAFPFVKNLIEKYKDDFKQAFMGQQQNFLSEKFGKENIILLDKAISKVIGRYSDDATVIDNMKLKIINNLPKQKLEKIDDLEKYAYKIIFDTIEKRIDNYVSGANLENEREE